MVIVAALIGRAIATGLFKKIQAGGQEAARAKAVLAVLVGFVIWTAVRLIVVTGNII